MSTSFEKEEKSFINTLYNLQLSIADFFHKIAIGEDYDDDNAKELFKVHKLLKKD